MTSLNDLFSLCRRTLIAVLVTALASCTSPSHDSSLYDSASQTADLRSETCTPLSSTDAAAACRGRLLGAWCDVGGLAQFPVTVPQGGRYAFEIVAQQEAAHDEDVRAEVRLLRSGAELASERFTISATDAANPDHLEFEPEVDLQAGDTSYEVEVEFLNDHWNPDRGEDRNLLVREILAFDAACDPASAPARAQAAAPRAAQAAPAQTAPAQTAPVQAAALAPNSSALSRASVFHIGHSLVNLDMPRILSESASAAVDHNYGFQVINGAPLRVQWDESGVGQGEDARGALQSGRYDTIVLTEAVPLENHIMYNDTFGFTERFYDLAMSGNPNARVFLYATWHRQGPTWRQDIDDDIAVWESISDALAQRGKTLLIIPAGQVLAAFGDRAASGSVPGISNVAELFRDSIHLTIRGRYLVAMAHYAAVYRRSPVGLPHSGLVDEYGQPIPGLPTAEQARIMQEVAWDVVRSYGRSGVGAASSAPAAPARRVATNPAPPAAACAQTAVDMGSCGVPRLPNGFCEVPTQAVFTSSASQRGNLMVRFDAYQQAAPGDDARLRVTLRASDGSSSAQTVVVAPEASAAFEIEFSNVPAGGFELEFRFENDAWSPGQYDRNVFVNNIETRQGC